MAQTHQDPKNKKRFEPRIKACTVVFRTRPGAKKTSPRCRRDVVVLITPWVERRVGAVAFVRRRLVRRPIRERTPCACAIVPPQRPRPTSRVGSLCALVSSLVSALAAVRQTSPLRRQALPMSSVAVCQPSTSESRCIARGLRGMHRRLGRLPRETAAASYKRMVAARAVLAVAEGRRHASLEEQRRHRTHTPSPRVYTAGPASASAVARSLRRGMCFRQPTAARE